MFLKTNSGSFPNWKVAAVLASVQKEKCEDRLFHGKNDLRIS